MKYILILVVGICIGYGYGWKDAKTHDVNIIERLVGRAGGSTRARMDQNIDKKVDEGIRR